LFIDSICSIGSIGSICLLVYSKTMESKIITIAKVNQVSKQLHDANKVIVLVGGCFDIIHAGHISFLQKARKQGDVLIVLLENDKRIKKLKGPNRPINSQKERALLLAALVFVDYVILLSDMPDDSAYDKLILKIKPAIIATTKGDPLKYKKKRQAILCGAKIIEVAGKIKNQSTSRIAKMLKEELIF
jgi:FAD synthetase